jgi:hypothetical protein
MTEVEARKHVVIRGDFAGQRTWRLLESDAGLCELLRIAQGMTPTPDWEDREAATVLVNIPQFRERLTQIRAGSNARLDAEYLRARARREAAQHEA